MTGGWSYGPSGSFSPPCRNSAVMIFTGSNGGGGGGGEGGEREQNHHHRRHHNLLIVDHSSFAPIVSPPLVVVESLPDWLPVEVSTPFSMGLAHSLVSLQHPVSPSSLPLEFAQRLLESFCSQLPFEPIPNLQHIVKKCGVRRQNLTSVSCISAGIWGE